MKVNKLIIHCSYTPPERDIGVDTIRQWHIKDNGWSDVGYHYVIRRDGSVEQGRDELTQGAHTMGHNKDSLGICMIGGMSRNGLPECNFTAAQWEALRNITTHLVAVHNATVHGHNEFDKNKTCPGFDVGAWWDK
jgi:N-acetyl-anhydromuramyl-L-alanine amidase AmpD